MLRLDDSADAESTGPPVIGFIGTHQAHKDWKVSGIVLYQDNALVVPYEREGIDPGVGDDFGVLLVAELPSDFEVKHTKTDFEDDGRYPAVAAKCIEEFNNYVNDLENQSTASSQREAEEEFSQVSGAVKTQQDWIQCSSCGKWLSGGA